jgi:hypothetical protein
LYLRTRVGLADEPMTSASTFIRTSLCDRDRKVAIEGLDE